MTQTVAIYARHSSDNPRDASIEDQPHVYRGRAGREGWTVIKTFVDHCRGLGPLGPNRGRGGKAPRLSFYLTARP